MLECGEIGKGARGCAGFRSVAGKNGAGRTIEPPRQAVSVSDIEKPDHARAFTPFHDFRQANIQSRQGSGGEFAHGNLALAPFKVVKADGSVQIGQFGLAAGLATGEKAAEQGHFGIPFDGASLRLYMLRRGMIR
jgi:hypothetical protein